MATNFEDHLIIPVSDIVFIQLVGRGGFGDVWKATWNGRGGGSIVAVKKIRVTTFNENVKKEIYEEVRILRNLQFKHILQLYGVCITENHELWMVLDYMDGGSLYDHLQTFIEIGWKEKINLLVQAAKAVNFLHTGRPQILHRDIKSPNFLITQDTLELKLTDFGTSKINSVASASTASRSSLFDVGTTARWAAPETATVSPIWSDKADIYSLGMVFYEIITGKIPFYQTENSSLVPFLVSQNERPPIPQDSPRDISALIQKCWHADPAQRPTSQEVLRILDEISAAQGIPPSPLVRSKRAEGHAFYEVNEEMLLRVVRPECITVLTSPPPFPEFLSPEERAKLQLPKQVKVVVLKRSEISPLISNTYEAKLFDRVELYFRRFFTPHDVSAKVTLEQVDVVLNPLIEKRFKEAEEQLHNSLKGLEELGDPNQSDLQREFLNNLSTSGNLVTFRNSNPISCWHGANSHKIDSIQWYGMLNLSNNDPGFYGKGMYFTQHPKYGEYYAEQLQEKTEGRFKLILCWALLGRPWAVTKVTMGSQCKPSYTSHYTVVSKKKAHRNICETNEDFEAIQGMDNYFPVLKGEPEKGDEIAVFDSAHVLPRFIVHYTVEKKQTGFMDGPSVKQRAPAEPINKGVPKSKPPKKTRDIVDSSNPFTQAGMVSTLAGSDRGMRDGSKESAKFHHPNGLCFNPDDRCLYVCDTDNHLIRKVTDKGMVTTCNFTEEGAPVLKGPVGIAIYNNDRSMFIVDESLHTIFKVNQEGKISVFAGKIAKRGNQNGTGSDATFNMPWCIAVDQDTGNLFVGDRGNHSIRMITQQGIVSNFSGSGTRGFEDGAANVAKFTDLRGIAIHLPERALFVCDNGNRKIRKISLDNGAVSTIFEKLNPRAITVSSDGTLFVATLDQIFRMPITKSSEKVPIAGQYTVFPKCVDGPALECRFGDIHGITIDEDSQSCFVADHFHSKIRKLVFA